MNSSSIFQAQKEHPYTEKENKYADKLAADLRKADCDLNKIAERISSICPYGLTRLFGIRPELYDFFKADSRSNAKWSALLIKKNSLFSEKVEAINRQETCTPLEQFLGHYFFTHWKNAANENERTINLNLACSVKVFSSLVERCHINISKIQDNNQDNSMEYQQLYSDLNTLTNLYWFPGTVYAAIMLLELGDYYSKQQNEQASLDQIYYEAALELFFAAKTLFEISELNPKSINAKLRNVIFRNTDLRTILQHRCDNWTQAQTFFASKLRISIADERFKELEDRGERRASGRQFRLKK